MNIRIIVSSAMAIGLCVPLLAQRKDAAFKTTWGDPDLQGTWTSDDTWGVPMERPAQFGTRAHLTEDELQDRAKKVEASKQRIEHPNDSNHSPALAQLEKGQTNRSVDVAPVPGQFGEYARRASNQTSQIVFPENGRMPALTEEGKKKQAAAQANRGKTPETWTDWSIYDRCISRGVAGSIIPVIYGNGLEIVQTPGYVAIRYEMVHDTRIIPTDGRAHLPKSVTSYMGDAVGHWEGNTLVVETTNFNGKMGIGPNGGGVPTSPDAKLTERFTRVSNNTVNYELTVEDPKTWTSTVSS